MVLSQLPVGVWSDFSFEARFNVDWESFTVSILIEHGCSPVCVLIICPHSHTWCCVVVAMSWVLSKSSSTRSLESSTRIRQLGMAKVHSCILSALPWADFVVELLDDVPLSVAIVPLLKAPHLEVALVVWQIESNTAVREDVHVDAGWEVSYLLLSYSLLQ